jgi:hypothetical protein
VVVSLSARLFARAPLLVGDCTTRQRSMRLP